LRISETLKWIAALYTNMEETKLRSVVVALMEEEEDEADEFDRERLEERIVELDGEIDG
jgi:hypothetical protein